jgi:hypothetical protein
MLEQNADLKEWEQAEIDRSAVEAALLVEQTMVTTTR